MTRDELEHAIRAACETAIGLEAPVVWDLESVKAREFRLTDPLTYVGAAPRSEWQDAFEPSPKYNRYCSRWDPYEPDPGASI